MVPNDNQDDRSLMVRYMEAAKIVGRKELDEALAY